MGKIVAEGHISNYETGLWTRGEAKGLINRSRGLVICSRDDFTHNIHNFISRLQNKFLPYSPHTELEIEKSSNSMSN